MNMKIQFILFFLVFLLVYLSLNSYVILRVGGLIGIKKNILYSFILLATLCLPISIYVEKIFPNIFSRVFYTISAFWMGILFFAFCALLIYEMVNLFYTIPQAGWIIISVVSLLSIISAINAIGIVVKEVEVPIKKLKKDITIVQLSDIHIGTIRNSGFLKKIVRKVEELNPDIVMITGDMVDGSASLHGDMFNEFNKLNNPIYFVTGNHEVYEGVDNVYALFNDTKIKILKNEAVNFDGIQIIGIEYSENKQHLEKALENINIDKEKPSVLMYHSPQGMEDAKKAGIDLQIAGHTHNGQIVPFNLLVKMAFKHIQGLYNLRGMFLYVSPGTGTWGPYMRLGSKNEITLLKLKVR